MPLNQESLGQPPEPARGADTAVSAEPGKPRRWPSRLLNICFAIFAFEIGIFLVVFPWMEDTWKINYFPTLTPALHNLWEDPYFRGALTGLGIVNIYVALWEFFRALRRT